MSNKFESASGELLMLAAALGCCIAALVGFELVKEKNISTVRSVPELIEKFRQTDLLHSRVRIVDIQEIDAKGYRTNSETSCDKEGKCHTDYDYYTLYEMTDQEGNRMLAKGKDSSFYRRGAYSISKPMNVVCDASVTDLSGLFSTQYYETPSYGIFSRPLDISSFAGKDGKVRLCSIVRVEQPN